MPSKYVGVEDDVDRLLLEQLELGRRVDGLKRHVPVLPDLREREGLVSLPLRGARNVQGMCSPTKKVHSSMGMKVALM
jgi:hypothetical protein